MASTFAVAASACDSCQTDNGINDGTGNVDGGNDNGKDPDTDPDPDPGKDPGVDGDTDPDPDENTPTTPVKPGDSITEDDIPSTGGTEETVEGVKFNYGSYFESAYVTYPSSAQISGVAYKLTSATEWTEVDEPLIREARCDIIGLPKGEYSVKLQSKAGTEYVLNKIQIKAYDRSGYAHFKRQADEAAYGGVGAYDDSGKLKEGALVIYVSEGNKNNVKEGVYKNVNGKLVKEDITEYIKPGRPQQNGKDLGGDSYWGIGYILNNRGYENNAEREKYGIQKLSQVYGAVAVRLIGTVSSEFNADKNSPSLFGLTYRAKSGETNPITGETYKKGVSVPNGGTVGDGGQMARVTNAYNLTVEGVGNAAKMEGWGIHFVSNDNLHKHKDSGTSFEVRNVTFDKYAEDALGMEGTQGTKVDETGSITSGASDAGADLISPVERCWIHNNTFLPGYAADPTESDKAEGDGSCDFKRGQYYTLSYNYFEYCHKTNLIGSSDNTCTYNVTMHHNWWNNCGSRQPLLRRANTHFYNNYISGDSTDKNASLSYITSLRANCYMFAEANYYDGCKQIFEKGGSGAAAKLYGNVTVACFGAVSSSAIAVDDREQKVDNACKFIYRNIDYSSFDTDPELFYYDRENKRSSCILDSAEMARINAMLFAGANGHGEGKETTMNKYTPSAAVQLKPEGATDITIADGGEVNGVMFNNIKGGKGKGQIITFTLASEAEVTVTTTTSGDPAPDLYSQFGTVYASKFTGTIKVVLPAGTYVIASGQKDKEAVITALSFADTGNSSAARIEAAIAAISALPTTITLTNSESVKDAELKFNALTAEEKGKISAELVEKLNSAVAALGGELVKDAIAKIDAIGAVIDENSGDKILAAEKAISLVPASLHSQITNLTKLDEAKEKYALVAVQYVISDIDALDDVSGWTTAKGAQAISDALAKYESVTAKYEALDSDQKEQVGAAKVKKLTDGVTLLNELKGYIGAKAAFETALAGVTDASKLTLAECTAITSLYEGMSAADKAEYANNATYKAVLERQKEIASQSQYMSWTTGGEGYGNSLFTVSGNTSDSKGEITVNGFTYTTCLKIESSTSIKFTTATDAKLVLYFGSSEGGKRIIVDGKTYTTAADGTVEIALTAGAHTITKGDTLNLFLISLS